MFEGSASRMLLTMRKRLVSRPEPSKSGKYFWFWRIVSTRHSGGTARNSSSKLPAYTVGISTSAVTSSRSAS